MLALVRGGSAAARSSGSEPVLMRMGAPLGRPRGDGGCEVSGRALAACAHELALALAGAVAML